ncbi:MAG: hypothetical protein LBD73_07725 [Deferribacteraceae bacterium]|nr:hypothetical protein [Deferribacteraceae bacterium]
MIAWTALFLSANYLLIQRFCKCAEISGYGRPLDEAAKNLSFLGGKSAIALAVMIVITIIISVVVFLASIFIVLGDANWRM